MDTDAEWEKWGSVDPYFGVITSEKFRSDKLTQESKAEFFESGKHHVHHVLAVSRKHLDADFKPSSILDFGCGTGRLLIPFAGVAEKVTGLDISNSMLREADKNCREQGIENVELLKSDDELSLLTGSFDFIHSVVVFQHIPVARGKQILSNLLNRLNAGGVGALHFTYSKDIYRDNHGLEPMSLRVRAMKRKVRRHVRRWVRVAGEFLLHRTFFADTLDAMPLDPEMQMNPYHLNELLFLIQSAGIKNMHTEFTDHGGELGVFLYFQKPR